MSTRFSGKAILIGGGTGVWDARELGVSGKKAPKWS